MPEPHSDALVLFGATGDLAYEQIFPALQAMTRRGHLDVPVIGVAKPDWTIEQLHARARASIAAHGPVDTEAFDRLTARLSYVAGDYQDADTFSRLRQALGAAERPLFYLAIPPSLFGTVASGLAQSGCAAHACLIVEKPFGRDLASAEASMRPCTTRFPSRSSIALITSSVRSQYRISSTSDLPTRFWSRSGTPGTSRACRLRWPRRSECETGGACTRKSARFGTSFRIIYYRSSRY